MERRGGNENQFRAIKAFNRRERSSVGKAAVRYSFGTGGEKGGQIISDGDFVGGGKAAPERAQSRTWRRFERFRNLQRSRHAGAWRSRVA